MVLNGYASYAQANAEMTGKEDCCEMGEANADGEPSSS
jgi:hypothetical protein